MRSSTRRASCTWIRAKRGIAMPKASDFAMTRRDLFRSMSGGICGAALTYLLGRDGLRLSAAEGPRQPPIDLKPRPPHFAAKARSVIHLFMNGGPSQMDLFDPKPTLDKHHGRPYFDRIAAEVENPHNAGALLRSPFKFAQHGQCGMWVPEALPHLAKQ